MPGETRRTSTSNSKIKKNIRLRPEKIFIDDDY